jgi:hypothetical protein
VGDTLYFLSRSAVMMAVLPCPRGTDSISAVRTNQLKEDAAETWPDSTLRVSV